MNPDLRGEIGQLGGDPRLPGLIPVLGVPAYATDAEGRITSFNEAAAEFWGRRPAIGVDQWCGSWRLFYPDGQPMAHGDCPMGIALREGRTVRGQTAVAERPDGSRVEFIAYPSPVLDDAGMVRGAVNVLIDITAVSAAERALHAERTRLRDSEARLSAELDDARQLQAISSRLIGDDDITTFCEELVDAAITLMHADCGSMQALVREEDQLELLAWRGFDPLSARFWKRVSADAGSTCGAALASRRRIIADDVETAAFMEDTHDLVEYRRCGIRAVQSTPLVSRTGEVLGMLSTHWHEPHTPSDRDLRLMDLVARQAADLLEQRRAAIALRESAERARVANEERVRVVEEVNEQLRAASAIKDEFLGLVSHELRTPITTVLGNAEILLRRGDSLDAATRAASLADIKHDAERLSRTIDDLLTIARVEQRALDPEPLVLDRVVREVVIDFERASGVRVRVTRDDRDGIVNGDRGVVAQILRNYLSNAQKYGLDAPIEVETAIDRATGEACIRVLDHGIGVDTEEAGRLFDPFYRSKDAGPIGGMGIGLSVCRRLAEAVGGRVWARARDGGGSEFGVALPLCEVDVLL